jgi:NDP-sugar pyrophosphorylase family protein
VKLKAVILSRGRGVHLLNGKSLTSKVLIPVKGLSFLYYVLKHFYFYGLTEDCFLEWEPMQRLISEGQANVFDHKGFWKQIDSWRDLEEVEKLFEKEDASWKIK